MNSYAVSACLLEKTSNDKKIVTSILHRLSDDTTPYKVVVDKKGVIIDMYEQMANNNNVHIASWLKILTRDPEQIETVEVDINSCTENIYKFLEVAAKIRNEKKLIVYSHNNIPEEFPYDNKNVINYNTVPIKILNNNEAMHELNQTTPSINIHNEQNQDSKNRNEIYKDSVVVRDNKGIKESFKIKSKVFTKENVIKIIIFGVVASLIAAWIFSKLK